MFNEILVPTDGSPSAILAARFAGLICDPGGGVKLLHVTSGFGDLAAMTVDSAASAITGAMGDVRDQLELSEGAEAARLLSETRAVLPPGLRAVTYDKHGRPADVILAELGSSGVDSVVVGSRGRGAIARAFFGSVADGVVRGALKPVLIARRPGAQNILVGIDGSESSRQAARAAALVAKKLGGTVTLLHVAIVPLAERQLSRVNQAVTDMLRPVLARAREEVAAIAPDVQVLERFVVGEPAHGLLENAAQTGAELIVVGRTGRTAHERPTLGSVAQRVATHADASVLVVP